MNWKIILLSFIFLLLFLPLVPTKQPIIEEGASGLSGGYFDEFTPIEIFPNNQTIRI